MADQHREILEGLMGLFRRRGRGAGAEPRRTGRREIAEGERHLSEFAASRRGVEAYLEPATSVTATTVMFIAADGEWTRRRVADPGAARALAEKLRIPLYDAMVVGYPRRMREWNQRRARERRRGGPEERGRGGGQPGAEPD